MKKIAPYLLLLATCAALFFYKLGATPLMGLDEGLYAECSREMVASGNYIVPTENGGPFFDKPPLIYWLQGAGIRQFGVNSFAVRLPSAISALLLVALVVFLGSKLFGKRTGLLGGFALAGSLLVVGLAHMCLLDQLFTLTITAALALFILSYTGIIEKWGYVAFWGAMGLSVMVKGPAGAVLIMGTVIAFLLIKKQGKELLRAMPILGMLVFCAVAVPWYIMVAKQTNGAFLQEFFIHQNLQRAMGKDFQHNMPFYTYIPLYLVGFFPWSTFIPLAIKRHAKLRSSERLDDAPLFLTVWACAVILIFSMSRSKLPSYILPSIPPSALLVGLLWAKITQANKLSILKPWAVAASVIAALVGAAMQIGLKFLPDPIPGLVPTLMWMGISLLIGAILCFASLKLNKPTAAFASLFLGVSAFLMVAICMGLPIASRTNATPAYMMSTQIKQMPQSANILSYRLSPPQPAISFYSQRFVYPIDAQDKLKSAIKPDKTNYILIQDNRLKEVPNCGKLFASKGPYLLYRFEN